MVHPNQEMQEDLEVEEIVEAEVVMVVTEVVASEDVGEVSVGETVAAMEVVVEAADSEVATKWEGEVTAETTEETGHTKC